MKNVFLKVGVPVLSVIPLASAGIMTVVEIASKPKDIEITTADDNILPMSMLQKENLELKVIDKKSGEPIKNAVFTTESDLIAIEGNKITANAPGEAIIKCTADGYNEKEFVLDVAKEKFSFDLTQDFQPIVAAKSGSLSTSEATSYYLNNAIKSPAILAEDIFFTWKQMKIADAGYKKLDVTPVYITPSESFVNIKIHSEGEVVVGSGQKMIAQDIEYRNIPITIIYGEVSIYASKWGMSPSTSILDNPEQYFLNHNDWLFYQKDIYDGGESLVHYWDAEKLKADPESGADIDIMLMALMFSLPAVSYWLSLKTPA